MKILWYRISSKCSDIWEDEASREYVDCPFHLIRDSDDQCMACFKSRDDIEGWIKEYRERLGDDWRVQENMR